MLTKMTQINELRPKSKKITGDVTYVIPVKVIVSFTLLLTTKDDNIVRGKAVEILCTYRNILVRWKRKIFMTRTSMIYIYFVTIRGVDNNYE